VRSHLTEVIHKLLLSKDPDALQKLESLSLEVKAKHFDANQPGSKVSHARCLLGPAALLRLLAAALPLLCSLLAACRRCGWTRAGGSHSRWCRETAAVARCIAHEGTAVAAGRSLGSVRSVRRRAGAAGISQERQRSGAAADRGGRLIVRRVMAVLLPL
jgi:hypothetical protein